LGTSPNARCSDGDFVRLFETLGPRATSRKIKVHVRNVMKRRETMEGRLGRQITAPGETRRSTRHNIAHPQRVHFDVSDGIVLVGSDGHYWPGSAAPAHRAFVKFCGLLKPKLVVMNGDALDGSTVSRHPPINWEERPTLTDEIEACRERLSEIEAAVSHHIKIVWTLGNHDARFETRLATIAPEYAKIHGFHLKDHFGPRWIPAMSAWVNNSVVIKHRWKGGVHSAHNNAKDSGLTMVTGHDHALRVSPYSDYTGTRYGVSTGCLADPDGPQFDYCEDNPKNHRAGFAVFTFRKGRLLPPELVQVSSQTTVDFRGDVIRV
jgi:hypothetical protein